MSTVHEIEEAIAHCRNKILQTSRKWFQEFDTVQWVNKWEGCGSGKLNTLAKEALDDLHKGRC